MKNSITTLAVWGVRACVLLVSTFGLVACGSDPVLECSPACPTAWHCTDTGCVPDDPNAVVDIAMSTADIAMACPMACQGATPYCNANHVCAPCLNDSHCPMGQICKSAGQSSLCIPGCVDDSRCANGARCCNGACVDVSKDVNNCGGCGNVCGGQHSVALCAGGMCKAGACSAGWGDCNMDPKDGCETSLRSDPKNCTACGMACDIKNAVAGCSDTDMPPCYIAACQFGWDDCNGEVKDGCETSVLSDVKNCGACGTPCAAIPNASSVCVNAACSLKSCNQGFTDCDGNPKNGCETVTATDANNCGACGVKCAQGLVCINSACTCPNCNIANAKSKCQGNQCVFDSCLPGYADCDGQSAFGSNGCEVNTAIDAKNCNGCGNVCQNPNPYCNMSVCGQVPPYPKPCDQDKDKSGSLYVICAMDQTGGWIAGLNQGGLCTYSALAICQKYNFTKVTRWGGTCGVICGYCDGSTCMKPSGVFKLGDAYTKFDGGGGNPQGGGAIGCTVMWECSL